jgi:salicylate hydroxylase
MYNGPNAHLMTYPVANYQFLNVLAVITDPNPWQTEDGRHTAKGTKAEAAEPFKDWHPTVRALVALFPEELDKWAIFDMLENPAASYSKGRIVLAGDAAHAAGPHLGSGAGFGIEDSLVLATLLQALDKAVQTQNPSKEDRAALCRDALLTYNDVRYDRTQWLIKATREAAALFQWQDLEVGSDKDKFAAEITWRFLKIWQQDIDEMLRDALEKYGEKAKASGLSL